jgi:hypothetical protein
LLYDIPSVGKGIDYSARQNEQIVSSSTDAGSGQAGGSDMVDLSQALYHTSVLDESSLLDISSQSFLDDSVLSHQGGQNENDRTVLEILNSNETTVDNEIVDLWASKGKREEDSATSSSSSPGSSNATSPLGGSAKRKVKKYAIEPDAKCVKGFDEIKSKLAHSVRHFSWI